MKPNFASVAGCTIFPAGLGGIGGGGGAPGGLEEERDRLARGAREKSNLIVVIMMNFVNIT